MGVEFDITEKTLEGVPVVSVIGEIDMATAPTLREHLQQTIATSGPTVMIDLLGVSFIDSTALGVLIGALKRCREAGGNLSLVIAKPQILKVFEISGLDEVFAISETVDLAQ